MIEGKSETIDEWYQILQQNYDKYESRLPKEFGQIT